MHLKCADKQLGRTKEVRKLETFQILKISNSSPICFDLSLGSMDFCKRITGVMDDVQTLAFIIKLDIYRFSHDRVKIKVCIYCTCHIFDKKQRYGNLKKCRFGPIK